MGFLERLKTRARKLKRDTYALWLAYRHPRTPLHAKVFSICIVAYALSPVDLIPDFIPVLGYLDDLILIPLGIFLALRMIPRDVMAECRAKAEAESSIKLKKNWAAGAIIIVIWLSLLALIGFLVWKAFPRNTRNTP